MSSNHEALAEVAEAILEHAQSITRLDANGMDEEAYESAYAGHVRAIRLLAVPHMDPQPDRELLRNLRNRSTNFPGVHVQTNEGVIQLFIDAVSRQHKVKLWNRRQLLKNEEEEDQASDW